MNRQWASPRQRIEATIGGADILSDLLGVYEVALLYRNESDFLSCVIVEISRQIVGRWCRSSWPSRSTHMMSE